MECVSESAVVVIHMINTCEHTDADLLLPSVRRTTLRCSW